MSCSLFVIRFRSLLFDSLILPSSCAEILVVRIIFGGLVEEVVGRVWHQRFLADVY